MENKYLCRSPGPSDENRQYRENVGLPNRITDNYSIFRILQEFYSIWNKYSKSHIYKQKKLILLTGWKIKDLSTLYEPRNKKRSNWVNHAVNYTIVIHMRSIITLGVINDYEVRWSIATQWITEHCRLPNLTAFFSL